MSKEKKGPEAAPVEDLRAEMADLRRAVVDLKIYVESGEQARANATARVHEAVVQVGAVVATAEKRLAALEEALAAHHAATLASLSEMRTRMVDVEMNVLAWLDRRARTPEARA